MENEIQPLDPQNEPSMDATNQQGLLPNGEIDHEGAMAKADLFKLGQYSYKLFKKLEDDDQLESWVQAKITKAADYITSVYHYMEFEMKFSEYGKKLDDSDVLSESQKTVMKNKLMEAKSKIRDLKLAEAKKTNKDPVAKNLNKFNVPKVEDDKKKKEKSGYNKHKNKDMQLDELGKQTINNYTKGALDAYSTALTRDAQRGAGKKFRKGPDSDKDLSTINKRKKGLLRVTGEHPNDMKNLNDLTTNSSAIATANKQDIPNLNRDIKTDKARILTRSRGTRVSGDMYEAGTPSAGLSKATKSAVVKKAEKGGDIGKPGKNFEKVAKKAGGGEKGKRIAAAAMWKNIKENTEMAFGEGVYEEDQQLDELNLNPWSKTKDEEPKRRHTKKNYKAVDARLQAKKEKAAEKLADADERAFTDPSADDEVSNQAKKIQSYDKLQKRAAEHAKKAKYEDLNESADLERMKEFLTRLNG